MAIVGDVLKYLIKACLDIYDILSHDRCTYIKGHVDFAAGNPSGVLYARE